MLTYMRALRACLRNADDELSAYRLDLARLLPQLAPNEALPPLDMHTATLEFLALLIHRGGDQLKRRGRFDEARSLWGRVAQESFDATQALSGLVDNLVFAGDTVGARHHAERLRPLLPGLRVEVRIHAYEVLIELAMREPDIAAVWSLLAQVKLLAPRSPSTLSFEGQIHWFSGNALAARDAFEVLLTNHPAYCNGLTIANDLAVMLFALSDLERAETMASRPLADAMW